MKQIFSLMVVLLLSMSSLQACVTKTIRTTDLKVIVMDTTQALLPDAEIVCGKQVLRTSFDGCIVLTPEQLDGVKKLTIRCEGMKDERVNVEGVKELRSEGVKGDVLIVRMTPKAGKESLNRGKGSHVDRPRGEELMYKTMTLGATAPRDYVMDAATEAYAEMEEMPAMPSIANIVRAGLLTAGEVNDFAKWTLWNSYLQATVSYQKIWQIVPDKRYTVQVTNAAGFPIVNYPVSLTDEKGNTIFQAVTDNTGKAELWNGLMGERVNGLMDERIIVDEACETPERVDVVFVFDATGSMGDELRYLQAEMRDVIARATDATGGLEIRTGAVVYRDHGDEYLTRISRLTTDLATTQTFIDKQEANGGGDFPEAVPEALMAALNSTGWDSEARARIAFLILDAPCHEDSATLALLHEQILNAAAMGVRIVPVVCSGLDKSGEYLMRSIALTTNGTSFFLTDDSGIGNTHLEPTTDSLQIEHLNDMLVRTIVEFSAMPKCSDGNDENDRNDGLIDEQFIPNPFETSDLEQNPAIPHGAGISYLVDISGKLLGIYEGEVKTDHLPTGIYFIKTYIDGKWYTRKIVVR